VDVVALHRKVHQAEPEPLAPARERPFQGAEAPVRPQLPDLAPETASDVQRTTPELLSRAVRDIRPGRFALAASAPPSAAPFRKREFLLDRFHHSSVQAPSDKKGVWEHRQLTDEQRETPVI
jgi:hypothetical protein